MCEQATGHMCHECGSWDTASCQRHHAVCGYTRVTCNECAAESRACLICKSNNLHEARLTYTACDLCAPAHKLAAYGRSRHCITRHIRLIATCLIWQGSSDAEPHVSYMKCGKCSFAMVTQIGEYPGSGFDMW